MNVNVLAAQLCPTFCNPRDHSPLGSSVHGILQARILEWIAIPFSRAPSWPRGQTWVSCTAGRLFAVWVTKEACLPGISLIIALGIIQLVLQSGLCQKLVRALGWSVWMGSASPFTFREPNFTEQVRSRGTIQPSLEAVSEALEGPKGSVYFQKWKPIRSSTNIVGHS